MIPLEPGLQSAAVIRTTFETLVYFPDDEDMRRELLEVIERARQEFAAYVGAVADELEAYQERFTCNYEQFQDYVIDMATRGHPGRNLDSMMRIYAFDDAHFYLDLPAGMDADAAMAISGRELFVRFLRHLQARILDHVSYIDRTAFNRFVFQQYIAIMFITFATTDPPDDLPPRD
jgi:hypothetical protein